MVFIFLAYFTMYNGLQFHIFYNLLGSFMEKLKLFFLDIPFLPVFCLCIHIISVAQLNI